MDGLHLTEFPDGPSQPTSQVCGAILFSLALSDLLFAGCLPIPSQVSELLQHAISIPQHADTTRLSWPTSEPPGENLLSLSFNKTNLRPYSTLHQSTVYLYYTRQFRVAPGLWSDWPRPRHITSSGTSLCSS